MIFRKTMRMLGACLLVLMAAAGKMAAQQAGAAQAGAAQADTAQAERIRLITDTLCAPDMHGRGYTFGGDGKAADFLERQFKALGLRPFKGSFRQHFQMEVNAFGGAMALKLDGTALAPGADFIAHALSGSGKGKAKVHWLDSAALHDAKRLEAQLPKSLAGYALAYEQRFEQRLMDLPRALLARLFQAALHVATAPKLTHAIAQQQYAVPKVVVKASAWTQPKQVAFHIEAEHKRHIAQNVAAYVPGTAHPDSFFVFTAHYDHLGTMGKEAYFPGANDNASGVAMLLELARHYAAHPLPYSVAFIGFGAEEAGLLGSAHYVSHPLFPLKQLSFLFNLDLLATGERGGTVVNATEFPQAFRLLQEANAELQALTELKSRGPAANSDHYYFYQKGIPCFFLYLMGDWTHYHDVNDRAPVPYSAFTPTFRLLCRFAEKWTGAKP
jgi:hypothetical protein